MLFESTVQDVMARVLASARKQANTARKEETAKRVGYYQDQQLDYLAAKLNKIWAEPDKLTPVFLNVVRKVINNLAMVYREEPKREIDGIDRDREIFTELAGSMNLNAKMKLANRLAKLLKTVLLRPVWRNGRLDLDLLTGDILDVWTGDSPEDLTLVMITHYPESGKADEITYSLWTSDSIHRMSYRLQVTETESNPYGVLPFVPVWDRIPTDSFWVEGGDDLVSIQDLVNQQLTELFYVCQFQGFGVGYIKSDSPEEIGAVHSGPGKMVTLSPNGEVGFAKTNAPIGETIEALQFLISQAAISNGLPAQALSEAPQVESGVARLVSNRELDEMRGDDIALFRGYEQRLFDLSRVIWNHHNPGRRISDKARLTIDFADAKPELSPRDQAETWNRLVELGVISPVDVAMERNPDLTTRDDALAHLLNVQEEMKALEHNQD